MTCVSVTGSDEPGWKVLLEVQLPDVHERLARDVALVADPVARRAAGGGLIALLEPQQPRGAPRRGERELRARGHVRIASLCQLVRLAAENEPRAPLEQVEERLDAGR